MATFRKREGERTDKKTGKKVKGKVTWQVVISVPKGKRITRLFKTKGEAREWAVENECTLKRKRHGLPDDRMTVAELIDRYVDEAPPGKDATKLERLAWRGGATRLERCASAT